MMEAGKPPWVHVIDLLPAAQLLSSVCDRIRAFFLTMPRLLYWKLLWELLWIIANFKAGSVGRQKESNWFSIYWGIELIDRNSCIVVYIHRQLWPNADTFQIWSLNRSTQERINLRESSKLFNKQWNETFSDCSVC